MLSLKSLTPKRMDYYLDQTVDAADEYYTGGNDESGPGRWTGSAAAHLGLAGTVGSKAFVRVLTGLHPGTGEGLGAPRTTKSRVSGFDLCFSAPKSVSAAWAVAAPEMADVIAGCHDRAVAATLGLAEPEAVRARRGAGGWRKIRTEGLVAAEFSHRTSRAGDPQLHSHVVVANLTVDGQGRWSALDGTRIFQMGKSLGYAYQAALRAELGERLGFRFDPPTKGSGEITGIPKGARDDFSRRRKEIVDRVGDTSGLAGIAAEIAALATRASKAADEDLAALRQDWARRAAEHGLNSSLVDGLAGPTRPATLDPDAVADILVGPDGLTRQASSFDRRNVLQAIAMQAVDGLRPAELAAAADRVLADERVVRLDTDGKVGGRWSTTELLNVEADLVDRSARRSQAGVARVGPSVTAGIIAERGLSGEQKAMVGQLVGSGAGVEVVVGRAGAGKTYALDAARAAWEAGGHRVIGAALAARAAAELTAGAGIPATTVDRLLMDIERPGPLAGIAPGTVVVVDEAAMVGTRKLARLAGPIEAANGKLVLVGDPRQLPEIDAGGALAALAGRVPTCELVDNRRQNAPWERAALAELRSGSVITAVDAYTAAGRIHLAADPDHARSAMVADWWTATGEGSQAAMYALRRADVDDLNRRARQLMDADGRLGPDRLTVAGREFAAGDRVVCGRNDRRLGVTNGTAGTLTAVDPALGVVVLDDRTVLPASYLEAGHLAHSYATTVHRAQGATVDRAFLLGTATLYREAGYVGLSRARDGSDLYTVDGDPHPSRTLSNSQAQQLGINDLANPDDIKRRAVLADPDPWILTTLGPPPIAGPDRQGWAEAAVVLDDYRRTRPVEPDGLGPEPDNPADAKAWRIATVALGEGRRHNRHLQPDHDLDLDLGRTL